MNYKLAQALGLWLLPLGVALGAPTPPQQAQNLVQAIKPKVFANYAMRVPGMYMFMGVTRPGRDPAVAPGNHSAYFQVDDEAFVPGVTMMTRLALDYLGLSK